MHAIVSSLTAAILFIHTVFGCCWHHARAEVQQCAPPVVAEHACCKHHQHEGESQHPTKPGKSCNDCEGTCTYVLPQKMKIDTAQSTSFLDLVAITPQLADGQIAAATWGYVADSPHGALPPLRLHLLHQSLLN